MATTEAQLLEAAQKLVNLARERGGEITQAADAKAVYDKEHGEAVAKDSELAAARDEFLAAASGYTRPEGDIP